MLMLPATARASRARFSLQPGELITFWTPALLSFQLCILFLQHWRPSQLRHGFSCYTILFHIESSLGASNSLRVRCGMRLFT